MDLPIDSRAAAAQGLAYALQQYGQHNDVLVLAASIGGVPLAHGIALKLHAAADLWLTRALRVPHEAELAMGIVAGDGIRVLNPDVIASRKVDEAALAGQTREARQELAQFDRACRGDRPHPQIQGKRVILVDDGASSVYTLSMAIAALRQSHPATIVVAIPMAPPEAVTTLRTEADEVVCLAMPDPFITVSHWYKNFPAVSEQEAQELLSDVWKQETT